MFTVSVLKTHEMKQSVETHYWRPHLASQDKERERLRVELEEARDKMRHRSLGNIKFIGELFKMKMLTASIMDDCIVKLLKNHDEESLECLCRLLSTIGKNLDFKKAKVSTGMYRRRRFLTFIYLFNCPWCLAANHL